jgi:hypothetical protein
MKVYRPVSVFDRQREGNDFLKPPPPQSACAPIAMESIHIPAETICTPAPPALVDAGRLMRKEYYHYMYLCQKEIREMKQSIALPLQEIGDDLVELLESITGLCETNDSSLSYGEHVSEIRQKAAALGKATTGPEPAPVKSKRLRANIMALLPKDPKFLEGQDLVKEIPQATSSFYPTSESETTDLESDANSEDDYSTRAMLVKARWLNNYKKYNRLQEETGGALRLQVGKYGDVGDSQPPLSGNVFAISPQYK